ncbi:hypothetical protein J6590_008754 [Homalodisca vitripennis]|nr:hypothetical protein J6590_008754 [Homalodisca vitripennis]
MDASTFASGRPLAGQAREIVFNVAKHLREQKELYNLKYNVIQCTSIATGISQSTVKRVLSEAETSLSQGQLTFVTPAGKSSPRTKKIAVDESIESVIQSKIKEWYVEHRAVPTLRQLNQVLRDENILQCSREYLRVLLKKIGSKEKAIRV